MDLYTAEFERTGFRGGLNYCGIADRNWGADTVELREARALLEA